MKLTALTGAVLAAMLAMPVLGQEARDASQDPPPPGTDSVVTVAEDAYGAGSLHRFFFGAGYRDVWIEPVEVQVLDLETVAGGLEPEFRVGGMQTAGLALEGADGKSYTFRSVDKDPAAVLPAELQGTPFEDIVRDQISSSFPGAALVANPLARAVGIPQAETRLVVMPDSPKLGEFREEFAGRLGTFDEFPEPGPDGQPGTFGAVEVFDGQEMVAEMTASWDVRPDIEAYLRGRLLDLLMGDWDRHVQQWRWAKIPGNEGWIPIPEDRDQAFSRYEGFLIWLARDREPKFDVFGPEYTPLEGLIWNARQVDRRFLAGVERDLYLELAAEIRDRLTDEVIENAVRNLPPEYFALRGQELISHLEARRDGLVAEAGRYYEFVAGEVDLRTTNEAELVHVDLGPDGTVTVSVTPLGESESVVCEPPEGLGEPLIRRRFLPWETDEVRLFVGAGGDRVLVSGHRSEGVTVRVVGGAGANLLCHRPSGRTFDFGLDMPEAEPKGIEVATDFWIPPGESIEQSGIPPEEQGRASEAVREWGSTFYRVPWFGFAEDLGLFIGAGIVEEKYDFRMRPYKLRHQARLGYAFGAKNPRFDYQGTFHLQNRRTYFQVRALASAIEKVNFFGFGNDTPAEPEAFFDVDQTEFSVRPRIHLPVGTYGSVSTGPVFRYVTTGANPDRLIGRLRPYGVEDIGQVGWVTGISYNNREFPGVRDLDATDDPRRFGPTSFGPGFSIDFDATYYPEVWDLEDDYLTLQAVSQTWLHVGRFSPVFGIQVGGQKNFGRVPYYDAAYLGGNHLRGLSYERFAGETLLYGNLAALLTLGEVEILVPGRWGVMLHGGTGRVWAENEESDIWHTSYGASIWWAPWTMSHSLRLLAAQSDEGYQISLVTGLGF